MFRRRSINIVGCSPVYPAAVPYDAPQLRCNGECFIYTFAVNPSSEYSDSMPAWHAFDKDAGTFWNSADSQVNPHIDLCFPWLVNISKIGITPYEPRVWNSPRAYTVYATTDKTTWVEVAPRSTDNVDADAYDIDLSGVSGYYYGYRLVFDVIGDGVRRWVTIKEIAPKGITLAP